MTERSYHAMLDAPASAPGGCPVRSWSPLDPDYLADPYPIASMLRDETPLFWSDEIQHLVVTRMEDLDEVFRHPEVYASTNVQDPVYPVHPDARAVLGAADYDPVAVMSNRSEPDHGRIRVYTRQGFSKRRLAMLEPFIHQRATELVDQMVAAGPPCDAVAAVAFPLPGETIFRFLGFPAKDDECLKAWCSDRKSFAWGRPTADQQRHIAERMLAYWRYCRAFVASKRDEPGDDFTSELLTAHRDHPDELSYREVESIVYGLSFAGHEAVTALIGNTLHCLLTRRDDWAAVVADPALIPGAVDEVLRFDSSQIGWRRVTVADTVLAGVALPAGTPIYLNFASANHQPDVFTDPATFDLHRADASQHISFGKGIHYCLGAALARLEVRVVLEVVAARLPSLHLVDGQVLTTDANITFRGPQQLFVSWEAP